MRGVTGRQDNDFSDCVNFNDYAITTVARREVCSDSKMSSGSVLPIRQRFRNEALTRASVGSLFSFDENHNSLRIRVLRKASSLARDSLPAAEPPSCPVRSGEIPFVNVVFETEETLMAKSAVKSKTEKLVPLGDRVVLKRAEAEKTTLGGIVLPDSATDKPQRGEVLAVGEGYVRRDGTKIALTVKAGDLVLFSSYAGDEIKVGDETYLLLRESDILATF